MIGAGIFDGDTVVVEPKQPRLGDVVVDTLVWFRKQVALFWKLSTKWRAALTAKQPYSMGRNMLEDQLRPIVSKLLKAKHGMKAVGKDLGSEWIRVFQTAGMCRLGCPWAAKRFGIWAEAAFDVKKNGGHWSGCKGAIVVQVCRSAARVWGASLA